MPARPRARWPRSSASRPSPPSGRCAESERADLEGRIERLRRRREQLGPVNPLAKREYEEAVAHVEELEGQREDLETAMRELEGLIRDTDRRIREAFEETFTAAAKNFEEVAAQLFPGGRGRLRLVREDAGPRPVLGGGDAEDPPSPEDAELAAEAEEEDDGRPHGRRDRDHARRQGDQAAHAAIRRREVDDRARLPVRRLPRPPVPVLHPRRGRGRARRPQHRPLPRLLRKFSDRAQFIVVTHQKRTMEAADCLYGVSMAGNGDSKVVSRRLPAAQRAA